MNTEDLRYNSEDNTVTVPLDFFEALAEKVAKKTASKLYDQLYSLDAQSRDFDNRLYNVRLLLKNYRMLKEHAELKTSDMNVISDDDVTAIEILDSFQNSKTIGKEELKLESIITSTMRTQILINYIDDMIEIYKQMCYKSSKSEDARRVDVLETMFLKDIPDGAATTDIVADLAKKWYVSERQIWRDSSDAVERLTALLFGVDGVNMLEDKKRRRALRLAEEKQTEK
mgnify:FL=1|nr:MAG TPA: hypothetical protein [Caudoviricetes sp.]